MQNNKRSMNMKQTGKILLIIAGVLLTLPVALSAAPGYCGWGFGSGWAHPMMYGGGIFMWIINLAVLVLAAFFILKLLRNNPAGKGNDSAIEILKSRLAKGEITKDEYEALKKVVS